MKKKGEGKREEKQEKVALHKSFWVNSKKYHPSQRVCIRWGKNIFNGGEGTGRNAQHIPMATHGYIYGNTIAIYPFMRPWRTR